MTSITLELSTASPRAGHNHARKVQTKMANQASEKKVNVLTEAKREELAKALNAIGESQSEADFCKIYGHFAGRVKSFLVGKGMEEETAEELMQEIMITVWRKAHTYDSRKAAASTWIFTIARNRRIDYLRGNYRIEVELDDALLEREPENLDSERSLDYELGLQQNSDRLFEALAQLPKEQKQVMHLSYFRGQSHGDIASWLGLPVGTVKSRIRLALQSIRTIMQDEINDQHEISGAN